MVALGVNVSVGDTTDSVTVTRGTEEVGEDAVGTLPPFNELQPTSSINARHTLILFNIAKPNDKAQPLSAHCASNEAPKSPYHLNLLARYRAASRAPLSRRSYAGCHTAEAFSRDGGSRPIMPLPAVTTLVRLLLKGGAHPDLTRLERVAALWKPLYRFPSPNATE